MMSELKYYIERNLLIMKIRLQGTLDEIRTYAKDLEKCYTIVYQSTPYKQTRKCVKSLEYNCYMQILIKE